MLKNYLIIAFRNLLKHKGYSIINIAGLSLGITCCILISLYIIDELQYDTFNKKYDRIYRIALIPPEGAQTRTPHPMAQALVADFPEVEQAVTMSPIWGPGLTWVEMPVQYKDNRFNEKRFFSADTTFFDVFTFKAVAGDPDKAIRKPGAIIITESIAKKYFGNENPIGKTIRLRDQFDLVVEAVIQDIPKNSHFKFDFLISYITLKPVERSNYYTWADFGHYNYIVLKEGVDYKTVEAKIPEWSKKYIDYTMGGTLKSDTDFSQYLKLQPLKDIHLKSHIRWELEPNGDIMKIYIFASAAILILLIACINFMNLATARSMQRAKEVGVRKTVGALRRHLVYQFIGESFMLTLIAMFIAVVLVELSIPFFNTFTGKNISFDVTSNPNHFLIFLSLPIFVGLLAGSYPAFFLSSFRPIQVLKGKFSVKSSSAAVRKGLVIFQFSISIFLIVSTLVIYNQLEFIHNKNLGFDKDQVIILPLRSNQAQSNYETFKNNLLQNSLVVSASGVSNVPGDQFNQEMIRWKLEDPTIDVSEMRIDEDFFKTLNIPLAEGRSFSKEFGMDTMNVFMINKSAADRLNLKNAVGEDIYYYPQDRTVKGRVIGVVKDFHYRSLQENIQPLLIMFDNKNMSSLLIRLKANHIKEAISFVEHAWRNFSPKDGFEYSFLDDFIGQAYTGEEKAMDLFGIFSALAIAIACLGLFGLAAFTTEKRFKEIGVRKVMGATSMNIILLLTKDFSKWVLLANIVAWPAAYFIMKKWLNDFAYRTDLSLWVFIAAGLLALLIALFTVGYQAVKAAMANPVDSLKYE